jgi:hypothetical protein
MYTINLDMLARLIIRIKPFRLIFRSITVRDNEGKVAGASIIDRVIIKQGKP